MFEATALIVVIIAWCAALFVAFARFMDNGKDDLQAWGLSAVAVLALAWAMDKGLEYEAANPCVAYESRLTYNAATKTMMPLRVCVERGQWEPTP